MTKDEITLLLMDNDVDFEITYDHGDGMHVVINYDKEDNEKEKK